MLSTKLQVLLRHKRIFPFISHQYMLSTLPVRSNNMQILKQLERQTLTALSLVRYQSFHAPIGPMEEATTTTEHTEEPVEATLNTEIEFDEPIEPIEIPNLPEIPEAVEIPNHPDIPAPTDMPYLPDIPDPPPIPVTSDELTTQILNLTAEPSLSSIGLGGYTPVGLIQHCMEYLHVSCHLPWWLAIAFGTLTVRMLIFPLVIMAQRNAAKMNNNLPQMQMLQMKMSEARQTGNAMDSARYAQEMMLFMKAKELNPLKNMIVPLAQAPLFLSFFMGLRRMTNAPIESMRDGGILWFTDLTATDATFMLPLITSATLYLTIEIGTDSARLSAQNMVIMKYLLRALPVIVFPFTMHFPAAILTYWACSNFISLAQVSFLRIPSVREYFKIEKMLCHQAEALPIKKKGFLEGMKDSWENIKISKEIEERQRLDEIRFMKAGQGPIVKTFKYDPTKRQPTIPVKATNK